MPYFEINLNDAEVMIIQSYHNYVEVNESGSGSFGSHFIGYGLLYSSSSIIYFICESNMFVISMYVYVSQYSIMLLIVNNQIA